MNIVLYPRPKINIGLRVTARRSDGYHDIETLFFPVDNWREVKAYRLLQREFGLPPVGIYLCKNIPVGAGMGGGSSDAAWTLRGLNELFGLGLSDGRLAEYAARLGSDCPFFIYSRPMYGSGRGEVLTPCTSTAIAQLQEQYRIKVIAPSIHVSTAEAYASLTPDPSGRGLSDLIDTLPVEEWKDRIVNDFERPVFARYPELARIKQSLFFLDGKCIFVLNNQKTGIIMSTEIRNKVEYIVVMIAEFAKAKHLTESQAFRYLKRFDAIKFLNEHYGIAHTLRMEDVLNDITDYCRRHGGAIA